jgi:hypothetical protein
MQVRRSYFAWRPRLLAMFRRARSTSEPRNSLSPSRRHCLLRAPSRSTGSPRRRPREDRHRLRHQANVHRRHRERDRSRRVPVARRQLRLLRVPARQAERAAGVQAQFRRLLAARPLPRDAGRSVRPEHGGRLMWLGRAVESVGLASITER